MQHPYQASLTIPPSDPSPRETLSDGCHPFFPAELPPNTSSAVFFLFVAGSYPANCFGYGLLLTRFLRSPRNEGTILHSKFFCLFSLHSPHFCRSPEHVVTHHTTSLQQNCFPGPTAGCKTSRLNVCLLSCRVRGASLKHKSLSLSLGLQFPLGLCFSVNAAPGQACSLQPLQHLQHWSQEPLCAHTDHCIFSQSLFLQTQARAGFSQCRPHKLQQLASVKGMLWF